MTLKTYSVLIAWHDRDPDMGEFGTIVRAHSPEEAEQLARDEMWQFDRENYDRDDQRPEYGRIIDLHEGAIWKAHELEQALRGLLSALDEGVYQGGWDDRGEREAARKLLEEITK